MKCCVWNQMKIWSSHLLDNLSNCLMNLKNSGDSTGFEPMTSAMPVQCSNQMNHIHELRYINQISFDHRSEQQFKQLLVSLKMLLYVETTASNSVEVLNLSGLQAMIASIAIHCDNQANLSVIIIIIIKTWSALLKFDFPDISHFWLEKHR